MRSDPIGLICSGSGGGGGVGCGGVALKSALHGTIISQQHQLEVGFFTGRGYNMDMRP